MGDSLQELARWGTSEDLCATMAKKHPVVFLSFSRGKDAIGTWLQMRRFWKKPHQIIPVHMTSIPGMRFMRESLDYYEDFFGVKILDIIHPSFFEQLRLGLLQPPRRAYYLYEAVQIKTTKDKLWTRLKDEHGLSSTMHGMGVRYYDNLMRRNAIRKYGPVREREQYFYPIFDWNKDTLMDEIEASGCKLPIDYEWFGCSYDGLHAKFLDGLRKHAPDDYQRVLDWFPFADLDFFRRGI